MCYKLRTMLFTFVLAVLIVQCLRLTGAMGQDRARFEMRDVLDLKQDGVNAVTFSPVSRELFVANTSDNRNLHQWNITTKKLVHTYLCPGADGARWDDAVVSPDGKLLVAANYPPGVPTWCQVQFIDTQTHTVRFEAEHSYLIREIEFDRSGKFIWFNRNVSWKG